MGCGCGRAVSISRLQYTDGAAGSCAAKPEPAAHAQAIGADNSAAGPIEIRDALNALRRWRPEDGPGRRRARGGFWVCARLHRATHWSVRELDDAGRRIV